MSGRRCLCLVLLFTLWVTGCDKLKKPEASPAAEASAPTTPLPAPVEPAQSPVTKTPQETIDAFLALPTWQRSDQHLVELAALPSGLEQIRELDLSKSPVTEAGLQQLNKFPELKRVNLSDTRTSNDSLRFASQWPRLEELLLDRTAVDSSGLAHLSKATGLKRLTLSSAPINDPGLQSLESLTGLESLVIDGNPNLMGQSFGFLIEQHRLSKLRELNANGTRIGLYGLGNAGAMKDLEVLLVSQAGISDAVLREVSTCPKLRQLDIRDNAVTDAGVKTLAKLRQLKELNLANCRAVTNQSLAAFKGMKQLERLDVSNTACSGDAVRELATRFLPDTVIVFNGEEF
ncbi:leucine-rich repeat domain-containing protein [Planctomicrobium sp. SH664]|uniref:leucine-rich repeat domain-containing protein n=1 Tax=Planctomicrobium sp. SH664 TaxID=3448125 RepID=UPI003F5C8155